MSGSSSSAYRGLISLGLEVPGGQEDLYRSVCEASSPEGGAFSFQVVAAQDTQHSDLFTESSDWAQYFVVRSALSSDALQPHCPSHAPQLHDHARETLLAEIGWTTHLSIPGFMLPILDGPRPGLAQIASRMLHSTSFLSMLCRVPTSLPGQEEEVDTWKFWDQFRTLCEHHPSLSLALELTEDLPEEENLRRWKAEPLRMLIIPMEIFLTNKSGYPVLSVRHKKFVMQMLELRIQIILTGTASHSEGAAVYAQYLRHIASKLPELDEKDEFEMPFYDYLQAPLQPLMDNLENQTYETFEKDPVKYRQYEEAVYQALMDRAADRRWLIMVLGAGRGPLVLASQRAAKRAGRSIKVYAVEKNPNAVITLNNLKRKKGWTSEDVEIISSDMRKWDAPEKADIIVSELLGSFGDNELSPECLDGAQHLLKEDGISIPENYVSHLVPIQSAKLYNEVKSFNDIKHFETPYVVKMHNACMLAEPQECFTFVHPNPHLDGGALVEGVTKDSYPETNARAQELRFQVTTNCTIHGFGGYFESKLYKDVSISILPSTFSEGMFSWFEYLFPLRYPVQVEAGSEVVIHMWRNVTAAKVWYEWAVSAPQATPIHNPNGRSYWIGL